MLLQNAILFFMCFTTAISKNDNSSPSRTADEGIVSVKGKVLNTEGGSLVADSLNIKIPNDTDVKNHSRRKGALKPPDDLANNNNASNIKVMESIKDRNSSAVLLKPDMMVNAPVILTEPTSNLLPNNTANVTTENTTKHPDPVKKPMFLSYDALNSVASAILKNSKISDLKSSSKPIETDQIPSPNQESAENNFYSSITARTPSMVIPILITMLVVPAIAALGYVGLRRGKEAWKNRHYKRMDFLLDGMYND